MKKLMIVCAGMCMLIAFASCGGSKESAYRKAYEKAKAQEAANSGQGIEEEVTVVAPVVTRPATQNTVVDNGDNVSVRQEAVSVISGAGLSGDDFFPSISPQMKRDFGSDYFFYYLFSIP